ncbi:MAG TPA: matrixin family metalloprotease [Thermoanaerobaculia bacterium]|nr:matrixin family metalloprotease [Thermoanaerobaculia bacterium]
MPLSSLPWHSRAVRSVLLPATLLLAVPFATSAQEAEIAVMRVDGEGKLTCAWVPSGRDPRLGDAPGRLAAAFTFADDARWSATASDGGGLNHGDPTTITWSIVPDGTTIPGFIGEGSSPSDLIDFLDGIHHGGAGPGGADLTQRAWWALVDAVFGRWSELTGLSYVYEPADDGAALSASSLASPGVLGVRGDVRIGGHSIDGQSGSNVLAYNFFPNNGEMVLDTDNVSSFSSSTNNYRLFRNTLAHEHGHGIGLSHVCPVNGTKLMEPFLGTGFDGPQQDDVLAGNRGYGDFAEVPDQNDTALTAASFGDLGGSGSAGLAGLSVDGISDLDYLAFGGIGGATLTATVTPTGTTYLSGPQITDQDDHNFGQCTAGTSFDALRQSDLALELRHVDGSTLLAFADAGGLGVAETITAFALPATGTYYLRVAGDVDRAQMYQLGISLDPPQAADLSIAKSASDDPSPRGASLWYQVTLTNHGPGHALGIQVTESLPPGVGFVETEGCAEDPGGVPVCSLGSLAAGEALSYSVRVTVDASGPSSLTNSVEVSSTSDDPSAGNDDAQVSTTAESYDCTPGAAVTLELDAAGNGIETVYLAEGTIRAGDGFTVGASEDVSFVAGSRVVLASGFAVEGGGRFRARTDDQLDCP